MPLTRRSRRPVSSSPSSLEALETRCLLSRITVTSAADNQTDDGLVTLREAILAANGNRSVDGSAAGQYHATDVIDFAEGIDLITLSEGQINVTSDITIEGDGVTIDAADSSRHFNVSGSRVDFTISGLTLQNGNSASGGSIARLSGRGGTLAVINSTFLNNKANNEGGAIHVVNPENAVYVPFDLRITDSTFTGNQALGSDGGAVYAFGYGETEISGSAFQQNQSQGRGGALLIGDSSQQSVQMSAEITQSTFINNQSASYAGAVFLDTTGRTEITDSTFQHNAAQNEAGAVYFSASPNPRIQRSEFTSNSSLASGGAVRATKPLTVEASQFTDNVSGVFGGAISSEGLNLFESDVTGNTASYGGGVYGRRDTSIFVASSSIARNTATVSGGGIYAATIYAWDSQIAQNTAEIRGGGLSTTEGVGLHRVSVVGNSAGTGAGAYLHLFQGPQPLITNSTFSENLATSHGGGLYVDLSHARRDLEIHQSTIAQNQSTETGGYGGGIYIRTRNNSSSVLIAGSIIAENSAPSTRDDYYSEGTFEDESFTHSLIGNNAGSGLEATNGTPDANGNLVGTSASPLDPGLLPLATFNGAMFGHQLSENSPAIDLGHNPLDASVDMHGLSRSVGSAVDMGAAELQADSETALVVVEGNSIVEGSDGGTTSVDVTFRLNGDAEGPVTVSYTTVDGTARTADGDYTAQSGTVQLAPTDGSTATATISVTADTQLEFDETFSVEITDLVNAGRPLSAQRASIDIEDDETEGVGLSDGTVVVRTSDDANALVASQVGSDFRLSIDGTDHDFDLTLVDRVHAVLGGGADSFDGSNSPIPIEAYGTDGDDTLIGSSHNDTLGGGEGVDSVDGGIGHDSLLGGRGNDTLVGGDGKDTISGSYDNDSILGGSGADVINGNSGNDTVFAGSGNDSVAAGTGDDEVWGASGDDTIHGNAGNDTIVAASGRDRVEGNTGDDSVLGGSGSDIISGGEGADTLRGGPGVDQIRGDSGNDKLLGEDGADWLYGGSGADLLSGKEGDDRLSGESGNDTLFGHEGNDMLIGGEDDDSLRGGDGHDALYGKIGNDVLLGEAGRDVLFGDEGTDRLVGGADQDLLVAGTVQLNVIGGIVAEWQVTTRNYAQRVKNIVGAAGKSANRRNGNYFLRGTNSSKQTVFDDNEADTLNGGDGLDLFFANKTAANPDRIYRDTDENLVKI